ncbi:cell division protein ZapE [Flavobacterium sp. W21_SRS_FM6]|uniref:cell division protein ZapE n=1 Tax=Flavobacterium sp. W21_SRS_FM6 TaxID=3240268 RepID=UPI003F91DC94
MNKRDAKQPVQLSVTVSTMSLPSESNAGLTSPLSMYRAQLGRNLLVDVAQQEAIAALDKLFHQLTSTSPSNKPVKGLYLWGDVGRGKTFLMDLFYQCLPEGRKTRLHFHRFMARIHQELRYYQGQQAPLTIIANKLASETAIFCFDELFVADIADAMILAGLFECLFKNGVILVATSNIPIERLYENGLARHKFVPCIALLQAHTQMLHLNGEQDHRLHNIDAVLSPSALKQKSLNIGLNTELDFKTIFNTLISREKKKPKIHYQTITICNRAIPLVQAAQLNANQAIAWFDFYALCEGPRSQLDYMEIANRFTTVMISDVPCLGGKVRDWIKTRGTEDGIGKDQASSTGERIISYAKTDDAARRFICLIDELYDQKVNLYLSTAVELHELYQGGALSFEFRRTYSRLIEIAKNTINE